MSEFDDFELARQLRAGSGPEPDLMDAQTLLSRRVMQAKRRRVAAMSSAMAVVGLLFVGSFVLRAHPESTSRVSPATPAAEPASVPGNSDSVASTDHSSTSSTDSSTEAPGTDWNGPAPAAPMLGASVGAAGLPSSTDEPTTEAVTTMHNAPPSSGTNATTTVIAASTQTFESLGGSITVRLEGGAITLVSTNPVSGFRISREHHEPDRITVTFRSSDAESKIEVLLIDGAMVPTIENDGSTTSGSPGTHHTTSTTSTTNPDNHGDG
ncbi:MAG: hypothetical protein RLZZ623_2064 [Actinomycetota bacterium]|jgi:hypothetical protein